MDTMETICSRKTIRSYTGEAITADELNVILKAANAAPVGMGQYESLHLTIITDTDLLNKIDTAGAVMFGQPDMHPLYGVPTLVLISSKKPDPMMENVVFSNAAIVAHNMALAATDLGVGSCYIWGGNRRFIRFCRTFERTESTRKFHFLLCNRTWQNRLHL